jgi:signal transduction histidine kinase
MKSPLELRVYSHPFAANNSKYVVFSVTDISHEKRRRVLERSFFHDISNTLTGVQGYAEILQEHNLGEANEWVEKMMLCVNEAVEELMSQKSLLAAEDGELKVERKPVRSIEILEYVKNIFDCKNIFNNSRIVINQNSQNFNFVSDRTLLARVLINAVKNAVEASHNDSVLIGCSKKNDGNLLFSVSNSQYIPEEIKNQIFKRSFSTKGQGRGLGTYIMKLLTERYLKGKIHFTSNKLEGTTFFIDLPLDI